MGAFLLVVNKIEEKKEPRDRRHETSADREAFIPHYEELTVNLAD